MDELNGRMMACQILVTGLIAQVANNSLDEARALNPVSVDVIPVTLKEIFLETVTAED